MTKAWQRLEINNVETLRRSNHSRSRRGHYWGLFLQLPGMKLKKQVTVCGAAIFCVAVFSLYLMLDKVQHDPPRRQNGGNFPRSQISVLQNRIEQLEQLLEENHEIISHIKDSVLELTANADGQPILLPYHTPNGTWVIPPDPRPSFYSISPKDCQFAVVNKGQNTDLQMLDIYTQLPFDNLDGGVWKQGFDITYDPTEWETEPLQVFVVPHSHNDPGVIPRSGWAVDPFGHSSTMPYLLKRSNLTSMLIQRVHYSIKKHFAATRSLEFMWRQTWDPDSGTDIFCHMMPFYSYDVPHTCGPDPKICCQFDFRRLPGGRINCPWKTPPRAITEANVAERANILLDQYRKKSKLYRSKVVLVPLGDDFRYDKMQEWDAQFLNYQKLFDYMNSHPELHVKAQFGTLSDYFDTLYKKTGVTPGMKPPDFPVLTGDFFSYADREDHYWTGYYTSRPFYKSMDRVLESHIRGAEILYSLAINHARRAGLESKYPLSDYALLTDARRNLGLFQHHDAITGTAKEAVVIDYGVRLLHSLMNLKRILINAAHYLVVADKEKYHYDHSVPFFSTDDSRLTQETLPEKTVIKLGTSPRYLVVFNPVEQNRLCVVSVLVNTPHVRVLTEEGQPMAVQLSPVWQSLTDMNPDVFQVSFTVRLPALGLSIFQLYMSFDAHTTLKSNVRVYLHGRDLNIKKQETFSVKLLETSTDDFYVENQYMQVWFSGVTGLLKGIKRSGEEQEQKIGMEFLIYGTRTSKDKSGAYLFLPDGDAKLYTPKDPPVVRIIDGPFFSEVTCHFQHVQQTMRVYNLPGADGLSVDISSLVDIRDHVNKEIAMRLSSDIQSGDTFFTDLNGFQVQTRKFFKKLPLQANFYPMPAMAYIQDEQSRLTLHTAQALGVSSLKSGQLEVILDRRLMQDDNRGLGQGLKDNKRTCNRFRLLLEKRSPGNKIQLVSFPSLLSHITSMHLNHDVLVMPVNNEKGGGPALRSFTPLSATLPCDIHILNLRTLQAEDDGIPSLDTALILHRKGFDCGLEAKNLGFNCTTSQGKLSLGGLFTGLEVGLMQSMSLTLMYSLAPHSNSSNPTLSMDPMEISTYRLRFS
ncbi:hypothetical protein GDO81_009541 [Engystomops pustulosus]|uniref:Alpha-mannosidase n=1 Tax=Engystomops pustulosus TaxID=76066 RepID=A0AAV7BRQ1_ENGPU|nr:hypothetical protein GDO81_009541 [Engystomops pustulosus]